AAGRAPHEYRQPLSVRPRNRASIGRDGSDELEDAGRREVLFGHSGAVGRQRVLDGVAYGGRGDDHPAFADAPEVDVRVEWDRLEMLDLDARDLAGGGQEVVHEGA